ncbi:MAG: hypothetical protein ABEJ59_04235 [Halanaeroarchaeum sp.]
MSGVVAGVATLGAVFAASISLHVGYGLLSRAIPSDELVDTA